jgi:hypothetical protein
MSGLNLHGSLKLTIKGAHNGICQYLLLLTLYHNRNMIATLFLPARLMYSSGRTIPVLYRSGAALKAIYSIIIGKIAFANLVS